MRLRLTGSVGGGGGGGRDPLDEAFALVSPIGNCGRVVKGLGSCSCDGGMRPNLSVLALGI